MKHDEKKIETLAYHESIVSSREIDKEDVLTIDSAISVAKQYAEHMVKQTLQEVEEKIHLKDIQLEKTLDYIQMMLQTFQSPISNAIMLGRLIKISEEAKEHILSAIKQEDL